jgi:hypothetical protein
MEDFMQKVFGYLLLSAVILVPAAWAQEEARTEAEVSEVTQGVFASPLVVTGNAGAIGFTDGTDNYTSRFVTGLTVNWLPSEAFQVGGAHIGVESGLLYSHVGGGGSNFIGQNSTQGVGLGANAFLIPLNVAAGYQITNDLSLTGRAGADAIYRSIANSMLLGRSDGAGGSSVDFFPALGLTAGWSVSKSLAVTLRGDFIGTPARDLYTATLGASFPLA